MNKLFLPPSLLVLVMTCAAFAQSQDDHRLPTPPFVAAMPDNSTWTISVTNAGTSAKLPPGGRSVNQFVNTKSGPNRALISTWTDGSQSQIWFWQGYRLQQNPGSSAVLVAKVPGGHDYQNADFFDLGWLSISNYVGLENQDGHDCYHFKTEVKLVKPPITLNYSAYIDTKTGRPVAWDVGPNHFALTSFALRKPEDPLTLPAAFADQLKAYRLAAQAANPYKKQ